MLPLAFEVVATPDLFPGHSLSFTDVGFDDAGIRIEYTIAPAVAMRNPGSGWVVSKNADWRAFSDVPSSRHSLLVARTGACIGHGPNRSASQIVRDLKSPTDSRFNLQHQ